MASGEGARDGSALDGPTRAKKLCRRLSQQPQSGSETSTARNGVSSVVKSESNSNAVKSTRLFCDMLYERLIRIDDDDEREKMQYEMHGVLMGKKRAISN